MTGGGQRVVDHVEGYFDHVSDHGAFSTRLRVVHHQEFGDLCSSLAARIMTCFFID